MPETKIIRLNEVITLTGLSKSTIYRLMQSNDFPSSRKLTGQKGRAIGWIKIEITNWITQTEKQL